MRSAAIVLDVGRGEARLGQTVVEIRSAGDARLRVGGRTGPVLRPVTWRERMHAVGLALGSPRPRECLAGELGAAATVVAGLADPVVCEVIALRLAGAGEPAPPFAEAALRVVQATGWDPEQLGSAEAAEVDRLAAALAPESEESGWQVLLLGATDLAELRAELADDLLARGERRPGSWLQASAPGRSSRGEGAGPPGEIAADRLTVGTATRATEPEAARESLPEGSGSEPRAMDEPPSVVAPSALPEHERAAPASFGRAWTPRGGEASARAPAAPSTAVVLGTVPVPRAGRGASPVGVGGSDLEPLSQPADARSVGSSGGLEDVEHLGWPPAWRPARAMSATWTPSSPDVEPPLRRRGGTVGVSAAAAFELGDALAALLDDEADLRGLRR